ncbi:hypothetical protein GWL_18280 [Herbaspirillum sp. GW103]|nr:hypothetical protein GWL_18280 [Herbaspirillum sp. GW103]
MPSMSLQTSSSSSAKGGEFGVSGNVLLNQGDWIINNGSGSAAGGGIPTDFLYMAAAAVGLWMLLKAKKKI